MLYSFLPILWTCSLQLRAEEPQLEATNSTTTDVIQGKQQVFFWLFIYSTEGILLLWLLLMLIKFLSWPVMNSMQCWFKIRVEESSPNRNPHRSGFFDRVVVNKTAKPGAIDIAAKTVCHHPLPFPQPPVTNLFFSCLLGYTWYYDRNSSRSWRMRWDIASCKGQEAKEEAVCWAIVVNGTEQQMLKHVLHQCEHCCVWCPTGTACTVCSRWAAGEFHCWVLR